MDTLCDCNQHTRLSTPGRCVQMHFDDLQTQAYNKVGTVLWPAVLPAIH
jgi:hypothetical protein